MSTTATDIIAQVRDLAATYPDYVYYRADTEFDTCSNLPTPDNPHGCIVGAAVSRFVTIPEEFRYYGAKGLLIALHIDRTTDAAEWLGDVQRRQDDGDAWSHAVRLADARVLADEENEARERSNK